MEGLKHRPHVICITEINPKNIVSIIKKSELKFQVYSLFCTNLSKAGSRGVLIYVADNIRATCVELAIKFNEYLLIRIEMDGQNIYICNIHRSPNSDEDNNSKLLQLINC